MLRGAREENGVSLEEASEDLKIKPAILYNIEEGNIMNSKELLNELNKFKNSNYNVVLIDGPWGSGKTYLINRNIKY